MAKSKIQENIDHFQAAGEVPADKLKASIKKGHAEIQKKISKLETLSIEYIAIPDIIPNNYNPNRQSEHEFELLMKSMAEDGFTQPIVVVKQNANDYDRDGNRLPDVDPVSQQLIMRDFEWSGKYLVVDGEHRWRAAAKLGYTEIPVVITDMTLAQARIATLRHNRARGTEDIELSSLVLKDLQMLGALEWAKDSLSLDDLEINKMLNDVSVIDELANEEFTQSWVPMKDNTADQSTQTIDQGDGTERSASVAVVEQRRELENKLKVAKSDEEKQMISQESDVVRLVYIYTGEQAKVIKAVLGKESPAERLYSICKQYYDQLVSEGKLDAIKDE